MKTYLVTGGAGFIGSHIIRELVRSGERVRCLDNAVGSCLENLRDVQDDVDWFYGDIRNKHCAMEALDGVDYVLHQAALPSVNRSIDVPDLTNDVNVSGTLNLLMGARDAGVRRFVYASSSSVYGNTEQLSKSEDMSPCPVSPYAVSKYAGELYCKSFYGIYGLPIVILRYFNVFGPGQKQRTQYSSVIANFLAAVLDRTPVVIYGDGKQTRDFTYVQNVVDANLLACSVDGIEGEVFNIASGVETSVNELLDLVNELSNCNLEVKYEPKRRGDVLHSVASIEKAKRLLGYNPSVSLRMGLGRIVSEGTLDLR